MKDEIKEIINALQRVADRKCYPEDVLCGSIAQEWVDYITNLQEENHNLYEFISEFLGRLENIKDNGSKTYIKENLELVIKYMDKNFKEYYKLSGDDNG